MSPLRVSSVLVVLLLAVTKSSSAEIDSPVINVEATGTLENLAKNVMIITEAISSQMEMNFERTSQSLTEKIQMLMSNAMFQFSRPLQEAHDNHQFDLCPQLMNMEDILVRIEVGLNNCTQPLTNMINDFQTDAKTISGHLRSRIHQIAELPTICQNLQSDDATEEMTLASSSSCFVQKIADINHDVGNEMHQAGQLMVRTHQTATQVFQQTEQCTTRTVSELADFLNEKITNC